jgi:enterochelin esterase-like enzyme
MSGKYAAFLATALLTTTGVAAVHAAPAGTIEKVMVHGASLEGALLGDTADREVFIYLPPGYRSSQKRRYPVIYSLHGFGGSGESWVKRLGAPESFDRAIAAGAHEMIVVMPDARTPLGGAMFSSSVTTGDWETFIARDLVTYVDSHYRTAASRGARGLNGFSMGGYGALRIAMKRPDVFSSVYASSSCCLPVQLPALTTPGALDGFAGMEQVKTPEAAANLGFGAVPFAMAAAWSPNPSRPPLFMDLPTLEGKPQPEVMARWSANAILVMVHQYVPALKSLQSIALDVGLQDGLLADNQRLHAILDSYGIAHHFETFEGGHGDMVPVRFEMQVLPYFSRHLAKQNH